jgi:hypothetical protein
VKLYPANEGNQGFPNSSKELQNRVEKNATKIRNEIKLSLLANIQK